jgi:multiple sugar transport system ATP-binding protein
VADFVGLPAITFLDATLEMSANGSPVAAIGGQRVRLDGYQFTPGGQAHRGRVSLGIRPERVVLGTDPGEHTLRARLAGLEPHGADTLVLLDLDGQPLSARVSPEIADALPEEVHAAFDIEGVSLFNPDSGERL